jgi:hypothetical protein
MRHAKTIQTAEARWLEALSTKDDTWLLEGLEVVLPPSGTWRDLGVSSEIRKSNSRRTHHLPRRQVTYPNHSTWKSSSVASPKPTSAPPEKIRASSSFSISTAPAVASGGRNQLQERLLAAYAACCGIDLTDGASGIAISLPSNILILHETGQYSKT